MENGSVDSNCFFPLIQVFLKFYNKEHGTRNPDNQYPVRQQQRSGFEYYIHDRVIRNKHLKPYNNGYAQQHEPVREQVCVHIFI